MGWIDEKRLPNGLLKPLTAGQLEVVGRLVDGETQTEIAENMGISLTRVKQQIERVAQLLPAPRQRMSAAACVLRWGVAQRVSHTHPSQTDIVSPGSP